MINFVSASSGILDPRRRTRHVLSSLLHHLGTETETVQDSTSLSLEGRGVQLLKLLVLQVECDFVDVIGDRHLLDLLLNASSLGLGGCDDVVDSGLIGRLDFTLNEVDLQIEMSGARESLYRRSSGGGGAKAIPNGRHLHRYALESRHREQPSIAGKWSVMA